MKRLIVLILSVMLLLTTFSVFLQQAQTSEAKPQKVIKKNTPPATPTPKKKEKEQTRIWTLSDTGSFLTAESDTLKVVFAYGGKTNGWFQGAPTTGCQRGDTETGGGGCDGSIVELYYKPTDPQATRNLLFRNGTWGSGYDGLDTWEAEKTGETQGEFDNPDYSASRHATPIAFANNKFYTTQEKNGKLSIQFHVRFLAWDILREYQLHKSGDITVKAKITVVEPGNYYYIGHRFHLAGSRYAFAKGAQQFAWGGNYQQDGDSFVAYTDGVSRYTGQKSGEPWEYKKTISSTAQSNAIAHSSVQKDSFTGFMLDSTDNNDPDIFVFNISPNDWESPFSVISRKVGQHEQSSLKNYYSYVETAMYSFDWAPSNETQVGMTWFYMTSDFWKNPGYWSSSLGSWEEEFAVIFAKGSRYSTTDYLRMWQEEAKK